MSQVKTHRIKRKNATTRPCCALNCTARRLSFALVSAGEGPAALPGGRVTADGIGTPNHGREREKKTRMEEGLSRHWISTKCKKMK